MIDLTINGKALRVAAAAIANAIAQATGSRLRDLPLNRDKVKAAMGA
jgi:CO/xanthine dehydrogenase Mo-binding subunit